MLNKLLYHIMNSRRLLEKSQHLVRTVKICKFSKTYILKWTKFLKHIKNVFIYFIKGKIYILFYSAGLSLEFDTHDIDIFFKSKYSTVMFFIPFGKNWVLKCCYHFIFFRLSCHWSVPSSIQIGFKLCPWRRKRLGK